MPPSPSRLDVLTFRLAAGIDPKLLQILYPDKFPAELSGADIEDGLGMGSGRDEGLAGVAQVEREEEGRVSLSSAGSLGVERPTSALLPAEATHHLPDALLRLPPLVPLPPASTPRSALKRRLEADDDGDELDRPVVASDVRLRRDRKARDFYDPSTYAPERRGRESLYQQGQLSNREVALLRHHAELISSIGMQVANYVGIARDDLPRRTVPFLVRYLEKLVQKNDAKLRAGRQPRDESLGEEEIEKDELAGDEDLDDEGGHEEEDSALTSIASLSAGPAQDPDNLSLSVSAPALPSVASPGARTLPASRLSGTGKAPPQAWTDKDKEALDIHLDAWAVSNLPFAVYLREVVIKDFPNRSLPSLSTHAWNRKHARGLSRPEGSGRKPTVHRPWSADEKAHLDRHIDAWALVPGMKMQKYVTKIAMKDYPARGIPAVTTAMWNQVKTRGVVQVGSAAGPSCPPPATAQALGEGRAGSGESRHEIVKCGRRLDAAGGTGK